REAEKHLAQKRQENERHCEVMRTETKSLETRIVNSRRALLQLERQRLVTPPVALPPAPAIALQLPSLPIDIESAFAARDEHQQKQFAVLQRQATALADQRLHLAELCERLALAQTGWHATRIESLGEMEEVAGGLLRRDESLRGRSRHT